MEDNTQPVSEQKQIPKTKPPYWLFAIFFILGLVLMLGLRFVQVNNQKIINQVEPTIPTPTPAYRPYTLSPPTDADSSTVSETSGEDVKKTDFFSGEQNEASRDAVLFQGESLITGDKSSATLNTGKALTSSLESNSKIVLVSTLPDKLLIQQTQGTVTYTLKDASSSAALRILGELVTFSGSVQSSVDGNLIILEQLTGESSIAFVDNDNVTEIFYLKSGKTAAINDYYSTVRIR